MANLSINLLLLAASLLSSIVAAAQPWKMHVIDNSSSGADGTKLRDVNGDGLLDITTGWEEGGRISVHLNPGPRKAAQPWPSVTVGQVKSPEDAVFVDLDGDGAIDVVSACEGNERTMFVHWAPKEKDKYLNPDSWLTQAIPASKNLMPWMFVTPMQVDGKHGIDLVAGGKLGDAQIGWFEAPANPRDLAAWQWHPIYKAGWIMSMIAMDMNGDGNPDLLVSDRRGPTGGAHWLQSPGHGPALLKPWPVHHIGGESSDGPMFLTSVDLDGDGLGDVLTAVRDHQIFFHRRLSKEGLHWKTTSIPTPDTAGNPKSVAVGDINGDGKPDVVFTCENAKGALSGVMWLEGPDWKPHDISGAPGTKYDLAVLIDMDGDGDLDVLTSEERDDLGVIWYENPTRNPSSR